MPFGIFGAKEIFLYVDKTNIGKNLQVFKVCRGEKVCF